MKRIYSPTDSAAGTGPAGLAGVVLAAGASSRLGRAKSLLTYKGRPLICGVVAAAGAVCDAGVTVVTGAGQAAVTEALTGMADSPGVLNCVHNEQWQAGMGSSLATGVRYVATHLPDARAILLMLCDQPGVGAHQLAALAQLWHAKPDLPAAAAYAETYGAPAVFPRSWFDRLMSLDDDQGARALLRQCPDLQLLDMPEAAADIDTVDDLYLLD